MKKQILANNPIIKDQNDSYTMVSNSIERSNWNVIILLSYSEIRSKLRLIYIIGTLFALGELILAFSLFYSLSIVITNPFKKMIKVMKEVETGNLQVHVKTRGNDEVSQVGQALNKMILKLNNLIDREYRAELSKRDAEYHALQSQVQPHFLYNTLNGLIGLNRLGKRDKLEKAILSLTGMLRYTLERGDFKTISQEFLLLQRYCELQKLRFDERLNFNIEYEEETADYKFPKLLLQPLVENSIIHGIEPLDRKGHINIFACFVLLEDNKRYLQIKIEDDGIGFDTQSIFEKKRVGISNVKERLKIAYRNSDISIISRLDCGTRITIIIPQEDLKI